MTYVSPGECRILTCEDTFETSTASSSQLHPGGENPVCLKRLASGSSSDLQTVESDPKKKKNWNSSSSDLQAADGDLQRQTTSSFIDDLHTDEEMESDDSFAMCLTMSAQEWKELNTGKFDKILRCFRSHASKLVVAISNATSYHLVGEVSLASNVCVDTLDALYERCEPMFDRKTLKSRLKEWKKLYIWEISDLIVYEKKMLVPVKPRNHGRPFRIALKSVTELPSSEPLPMDLKATADHFVSRLSSTCREILKCSLGKLNGRTLRIGTTCSGSDICVTVVKQTVQYLNQLEAHMLEQHDVSKSFIYIYI